MKLRSKAGFRWRCQMDGHNSKRFIRKGSSFCLSRVSCKMDDPMEKLVQLLKEGRNSFGQASRILADVFAKDYSFLDMKNLENDSRDLFTKGALAAIQCKTNVVMFSNDSDFSLKAPPVLRKVTSVDDLLTSTDDQFNLHVNACRYTISIIFDAIKLLNPSFQYSDLLMLIWYLSSEVNTLDKVATMFRIPKTEDPLKKLEDVASIICRLQRNSKMYLPEADYEEEDIVGHFEKQTGLPNVLGALGVFVLDCCDGSLVSVLVVCDHNRNFRHLGLNTNQHIIEDVIKNDVIYERLLQDHPRDYSYFCPSEGYPTLPRLFPGLREDELNSTSQFEELPHFGLAHDNVITYLRTSVKEIITRFPKLSALETASKTIITSAFILHNFCCQIQVIAKKRMQQKTS